MLLKNFFIDNRDIILKSNENLYVHEYAVTKSQEKTSGLYTSLFDILLFIINCAVLPVFINYIGQLRNINIAIKKCICMIMDVI